MRRYQRLGLVLVVILLLGAGVSVAASSSASSPRPAHHVFALQLARRFAVFSHGAGLRHKPLPAAVVRSFNDPAQAAMNFGPDAAAAVYEVPNAGHSFGFWVVPGSDGACLVWETNDVLKNSPHAVCAPLAPVSSRGLSQITSSEGHNVVFGLVPNGAASVAVGNGGRTAVSAPVANNAYVVIDAGTPRWVASFSRPGWRIATLLSLR